MLSYPKFVRFFKQALVGRAAFVAGQAAGANQDGEAGSQRRRVAMIHKVEKGQVAL